MKRYINIILIIILVLFITSCKKNKPKQLDYRYVGVYLNIDTTQSKQMDDHNVKLYIDLQTNRLISENSLLIHKWTSNQIITPQIYKENEKNIIEFGGSYTLTIKNIFELNSIEVYPIINKNGVLSVKTDESSVINLVNDKTQTLSFERDYLNNEINHYIKVVIKITKKEVIN